MDARAPDTAPSGVAATKATTRFDAVALALLGLIVGLACRGHFVMPFADFLDFLDTGHALLDGRLPASLKRAPVYPVLVAGLGRLLPGEAPERTAAEGLNILLLALNGLLIYAIGRRWVGGAARWAAAWFLLAPFSIYCTAHLVAEPLLVLWILLTVLLAQRGSRWAYLAAALATMTRYDAAGLVPGLVLAEVLTERRWRGSLVRGGLALLPLALWLVLTGVNWDAQQDHYIAHFAESPGFDIATTAGHVARVTLDPAMLRLPAWMDAVQPQVRAVAWFLPLLLAVLAAVVHVRRRDAATVVMLVAGAAYVVVHAAYPFDFARFGYPVAPLYLLLAAAGIGAVARAWPRVDPRGVIARILLRVAGVLLVALLCGEVSAFATAAAGTAPLTGRVGVLVILAAVALWSGPLLAGSRRLAQLTLLLGVVVGATLQVGQAAATIGSGRDLENEVEAARWIRANLPADVRVLSASPGLLRLYAGRMPPDRFVHFEQVTAESWPDVLAECRARGIEYIVWHAELWAEHGPYYAEKWRLDRFTALGGDEPPPGVEPVRFFPGRPNVVIYGIGPVSAEESATRPAATGPAAGG